MEILVTLRKRSLLENVLPFVDGVIIGRFFTSSYHLSSSEMRIINNYCKANNKKVYVQIDDFVNQDELEELRDYMGFVNSLKPDGIYFHDLGVYQIAGDYDLIPKLIYDGKSVLCNSLDTRFMLKKGIDAVMLSRELTLEEIQRIAANNPGQVDIQIFGHQRMSYSRRKFLKNYFKEVGKDYDYLNKETLYLVEEKRDYKMPIVEDQNGTYIYTDYIFEMFEELPGLERLIKRGVIETLFIENDDQILKACREFGRLDAANAAFVKAAFCHSYPDVYSSGYLYQKTNISKDE